MKLKKTLIVCLLLSLTAIGIGLVSRINPPLLQKSIYTESFGDMAMTQPMWGSQGLALVFADTKKLPAFELGQRLAATGITVAVVDSQQYFKDFNADTGQCLDAQRIAASMDALLKMRPVLSESRLIVSGIAEGSLIPFINAQSVSKNGETNISIGFSVKLPDNLILCPPLLTQHRNQKHTLASSPVLEGNWRSVWTDEPDTETAIFIKTLGNADTRIAAYNTPLDAVLQEELSTLIGKTGQSSPPMPVVETPAAKPSDTVTIFYSGDGGWRDLDRTVAKEMAGRNYPVVGVDVLRYFWEHKTPEQAATDLSAAMAYYRKNWGIKSFVLAGYSFGADILPAIYNRLPQQDRDSVTLLTLLALGNHANFEIHVAGWLGQDANEQPLTPELAQIPRSKILCIYGKDEKDETACTDLSNSEAKILELPGGHHFDQDYPKLTRQILDVYRQHNISN